MKSILIIDDDEDIRDVMSMILKETYQIKNADSKEMGTEMLADYKPDLIVLDVMMEDMDSGFKMCRDLKKNENFKNIKILMVTNIDNETKINFKAEMGDEDWLPVDDYIIKPL